MEIESYNKMILLDSIEQEHFRNAMNTIPIASRALARKSYQKSRAAGQTHAAAMTTMRNMFTEEISLIEKQFELIKQCCTENLHQSSKEGKISKGTNKNLGPVKKMMGNKTIVNSYVKILADTPKEE